MRRVERERRKLEETTALALAWAVPGVLLAVTALVLVGMLRTTTRSRSRPRSRDGPRGEHLPVLQRLSCRPRQVVQGG